MTPPRLSLGQIDTRALIERMGALRAEVVRVLGDISAASIPAEALGALVDDIDRGALLITGDPSFFDVPAAASGTDAPRMRRPVRRAEGWRSAAASLRIRFAPAPSLRSAAGI